MPSVKVHEAKTNLSRLIERARSGEEVIIARGATPVVRLVPVGVVKAAAGPAGCAASSGWDGNSSGGSPPENLRPGNNHLAPSAGYPRFALVVERRSCPLPHSATRHGRPLQRPSGQRRFGVGDCHQGAARQAARCGRIGR